VKFVGREAPSHHRRAADQQIVEEHNSALVAIG
jgi:hypothetical protein